MKIYIAASMDSKKEAKDIALKLLLKGHIITSTWFDKQSYDTLKG